MAATGTTGMAGIWEVAAGQPLRDVWRAAPPYAQANGVAFAPDGSWLVIGDNECCASIWAIQGGEPTAVLQHGSLVNQVVAGRDGDWVIAIGVDESSMWHVASGELIRRFAGMSAAGALSPDGELLAGAIDGGVSIRQVATGTEVHRLRGHEAGVTSISFHPNGRYLITASADGSVRAWALEIDELLEIADMRATRSLTEDECRQYHLDPCPPR